MPILNTKYWHWCMPIYIYILFIGMHRARASRARSFPGSVILGLGCSRARLFSDSVVPGLGHSRDPVVPGSWNVYWGLYFILLIIKHLEKRTIHPGTPSPSFPGFGYSRARCSRVCISLPEIFYDEQNKVRASINISTTGNDRTPGMTEPGNNRAR
jgi:hypothetical protein